MDNDSVVEQIVKSLSFEVVAVPQDNVLQLTTTTKAAPLNVKIRVRKKEEASFRNGVISLPKSNRPDNASERVRLASSDQTIMSFNVVMEADFQKPTKKPRRIWKIFKPNDHVTSAATRNKTFFGRCKPGGCLDPPFGEDRLPYVPAIVDEQTTCGNVPKGQRRASSIFSNKLFHKKKKSYDSDRLDNNVIQNENKAESVVDLCQAESQKPYSTNSIMTYPPTLNSSEQQEEKRTSRIYTDPSKNSFNEHSGSYFMIPKKQKNVLDKNNIIKDENDGNIWDSKLSEALNKNSGGKDNKENLTDDENKASIIKNSVTEKYLTESVISNNIKEQIPVESLISDDPNYIIPIPIPIPIITQTEQHVNDKQRKESQDKNLVTTKRNSKSNNVFQKSSSDSNLDEVFQSDKIVPNKYESSTSEQIVSENKPGDKSVITIDAKHESSNLDLTKSSSDDEMKSSVKNIENQGFTEIPTPIFVKDAPLETIKYENNDLQHLWKNKNDPMASDIKLQKDNESDKPIDKINDKLNDVDGKETYEQTLNRSFSDFDGKIREQVSKENDLKSQSENVIVNNSDLPNEVHVIPESIKQNDDLIENSTEKNDSVEVPKVFSNLLIESGQKTITNIDDLQFIKPFAFEDNEINNNDSQKSDAEIGVLIEGKGVKESESSKTNSEQDLLQNEISTESKTYDEENGGSLSGYITEDKIELDNNSKASSERDSYSHNMEKQIEPNEDETQSEAGKGSVQDTKKYASKSKLDTRRDGEASPEQTSLTKINEEKIDSTKKYEANSKHETPHITDKTQGILKDSEVYESNDKKQSPTLVDASEQEEVTNQLHTASDKHIKFDSEIKIESKITKTSPRIETSEKVLSDEHILNQPCETMLSNKAAPIFVSFVVQSYVDDMNQMIVKSLDADHVPKVYSQDSVMITKRYLNTDEEIQLPIGSENNLCIQIKSNKPRENIDKDEKLTYREDKGIIETPIVGINRQYLNESDLIKRNAITAEGLRRTLEGVYEKELLPLRSNISELQDNIEMLTQHMLLNGHMFVKKSRSTKIIPTFKKCSCTRK